MKSVILRIIIRTEIFLIAVLLLYYGYQQIPAPVIAELEVSEYGNPFSGVVSRKFPGSAVPVADNQSWPESPATREKLKTEAFAMLDSGNNEAAFLNLLKYTGIQEKSPAAESLHRRLFADHPGERIRALFNGDIFIPTDSVKPVNENPDMDASEKASLSSRLVDEGISLFEKERYSEALLKFQEASVVMPENYRALYLSGRTEAAVKNFKEAVHYYNEALHYAPANADIHFYKGKSLFLDGQPRLAADSFRSAAELNPEFAEAWFNLGIALESAGDFAEAGKAFENSFHRQPAVLQAAYKAQSMYEAAGLPEKAAEMKALAERYSKE